MVPASAHSVLHRKRSQGRSARESRRGSVLVLFALMMVAMVCFAAFSVDIGYLTLTRTELQCCADASALAAVMEGKVPVSNTVLILSGGNMTAEVIGLALSRSGEQ